MDMITNRGIQAGPGVAMPGAGRAGFGQAASSAMSMRWSALHDAAAAVAALAGIPVEAMTPEFRAYPARIRDVGGWRRELAERGVEDLSAIMEPGLAALLAVHARGGDARAAAASLWEEFVRARDGLVALLPADAATARAL